ncbi:calcium/sodium antiporter [Oceanibaculum indicum]|uniref:CaCA family Na(+)/Ca(+) antiporter n=1 Tax=Oceanibaculum indicum P24 TaxID=1207063 RepID=K2J9U3_9PROT|nr:calcium/sodium antiporter [Oceanibaculum indicum]EKE71587.1 CaCA family Na(+)/Ca(+) antiporter [Oceanibaculum indicum P24]
MLLDFGMVAAGLLLLFLGGEGLVRGSVAIATRLGISKLVVGMVIVGFGTSAPELVVSLQAALAGSPDIALGNVVGSNIANILLILGIAALLSPLGNSDGGIRREALVMLLAATALVAALWYGEITRLIGFALLAGLALHLALAFLKERKSREDIAEGTAYEHEADEVSDVPLKLPIAIIATLAGLGLLVAGAELMVEGATAIARDFGVSEAVIGLTIVAVGTSLPELATAIVAAIRRHSDVVLANIVGSNIFNVLAILGITATIAPIGVSERFLLIDGPIMLAITLLAFLVLLRARTVGRVIGSGFLMLYIGYIGMLGYMG